MRDEYGKKIDLTPLAETWECSVHPEYLGTKVKNAELPVLVKFIDAKKDLSVQVHPDDDYALEYEGDNGKTEMWYVINAEEDTSLIYRF